MTEENGISDDRPIKLVEIAAKIGRPRASILKFVRRRGLEPFKLQEGENKPYYLSPQDVQALLKKLEDEKYYRIAPGQEKAPPGLSGVYAIEVPAYDGSIRLKIGWSDNITDRLNTYRGIVPDLRVSRIWTCSANWCEQMALTWAERNGRQIGQEIFEFESNDAALHSLDDLFASLGIKPQTTPP